jgi:hypothetical protein
MIESIADGVGVGSNVGTENGDVGPFSMFRCGDCEAVFGGESGVGPGKELAPEATKGSHHEMGRVIGAIAGVVPGPVRTDGRMLEKLHSMTKTGCKGGAKTEGGVSTREPPKVGFVEGHLMKQYKHVGEELLHVAEWEPVCWKTKRRGLGVCDTRKSL